MTSVGHATNLEAEGATKRILEVATGKFGLTYAESQQILGRRWFSRVHKMPKGELA